MSTKQKLQFRLHKETEFPQDLIDGIPSSGPADEFIDQAMSSYHVDCSLDDSIKYLKTFGVWSIDELQDLDANISRLLWTALLDCKEQNTNYWYMGE